MALTSPAVARWLRRRAFSATRRCAFYTDMAASLNASIAPYQALEKMIEAAGRERATRRLVPLYRRMARAMQSATHEVSFAKAVAPEVPAQERIMLLGADKAGAKAVTEVLQRLSGLIRRQIAAREKLRKALVKNAISAIAVVGAAVAIAKLAVPKLQAATTPEMAKKMLFAPTYFSWASNIFTYGAVALIALGGLSALVAWSLPNWSRDRQGWKRSWFDRHLLPWSLYTRTQATYFLATAAVMLSAGISLKEVLADLRTHASPWMRKHLRTMLAGLERGASEAAVLDSPMLPSDTRGRLLVYALMPSFSGVMTELSEDNFRIYEARIDLIDGVLRLVSLAVLVLFILATGFAVFDFASSLLATTNVR